MDDTVTAAPSDTIGGRGRSAVRAVLNGYRATWQLLGQTMRRPFGVASSQHRLWLFPQFFVVCGLGILVGMAQGYWWSSPVGPALSVALLALGLWLTAIVGRAKERGKFDEK